MTLPLFPVPRPEPIVLLDLNHTLAENSGDRFGQRGSYSEWISTSETYRRWLVELLRDRTVLLVTARHARYEAATMQRIANVCGGWQPAEIHFRTTDEAPPAYKARTFVEEIAPRWGRDPTMYFGLESNAATRRAYARLGVQAVRVPESYSRGPASLRARRGVGLTTQRFCKRSVRPPMREMPP